VSLTEETQQRAHAVLSASGWKKWSTCTMAAAMEAGFEDEESPWSREGTFAHELGELLLRAWVSGNDDADIEAVNMFCNPEHNPDAAEFYSDEMLGYVNVYVQHVISIMTGLTEAHGQDNVTLLIERRLNFSSWVPQGFGTADAVILYPGGIVVVDLKYGAGVLVKDLGQLRLYALGAYGQYGILYEPEEVTISIVQPRKDSIVTDTVRVEDLLTWADELVVPRAKIAWAAYNGDRTHARFSPGEHCTTGFCKARYTCSARARYMLEAAEQPFAQNAPDLLTTEQLEAVVDRARLAVKWLSDCERHLTEQARAGKVELKNHVLAPGRSTRKIKDETAVAQLLMSQGYPAEEVYQPPKLRGLLHLEQLVGDKLENVLGDLIEKPPGELRLVPRLDETNTRPVPKANTAAAAAAFDDIED